MSTVVTPSVTLAGVALLEGEIDGSVEDKDDRPVEPEVEPGHEDNEDSRSVDLEEIVSDGSL